MAEREAVELAKARVAEFLAAHTASNMPGELATRVHRDSAGGCTFTTLHVRDVQDVLDELAEVTHSARELHRIHTECHDQRDTARAEAAVLRDELERLRASNPPPPGPDWDSSLFQVSGTVLYSEGEPLVMCVSPGLARDLAADLAARRAVALPLVRAADQWRENHAAECERQFEALERQLKNQRDELELLRQRDRGHLQERHDTERVLAEALGYHKAPEDDPDSPCPGEYATGEHTITTLATEAAAVIRASRVKLPRAVREAHGETGGVGDV